MYRKWKNNNAMKAGGDTAQRDTKKRRMRTNRLFGKQPVDVLQGLKATFGRS